MRAVRVNNINLKVDDSCLSEVINIRNYNSLNKLLRVTAWVMRFISNLKKKTEERRQEQLNNIRVLAEELWWLSAEEIYQAKLLWIKDAQKTAMNHKNFKDWKVSLNLFTDEKNLLRCRGRLEHAPIPYEAKYPLLLTTDAYLTTLVVLDSHNMVAHNRTRQTLNHIRQTFWIPKGRSFVRKVIKPCWLCKYFEGKAYRYPNPPSLPKSRLNNDRAFNVIGIDYAGPLFVKNIYGESKEMFKTWIALVTCASSRALYLDLVVNSSGKQCVEVIKRLIARYGAPHEIISDNGKAFISEETQDFASCKNIKWRFNIEAAPWQGGFFERMVKSVKRCLKKVLLNARVTFNELLTILSEIEMIINNRPLTYSYDEITEVPLTPNHLIYGRSLNSIAVNTDNSNTELTNDKANQRTKYVSNLLKHFWKRWANEYVTELREYQKLKNINDETLISRNDVVLIVDDRQPRIAWRVGRVTELIKGRDNVVRGAKVSSKTEQGRLSTLRRPINKLVPLELYDSYKNEQIGITFVDEANIDNLVD